MSELCFTYREVLGDVVENLCAVMCCTGCPAACRMCCLNSIAYIFTITFTYLSDYMPSWIVDIPAVARVRTYILVEALFATFAAKAAFTVAAKARRCIKQISAVDPHRSSFQFGGHVQGEVDVLAPHTGREPIARVVRQLYCLGGGAESHRYEHRSKDLDLGDGRGRGDVGKERRWEEVALGGTGPGWLPHYRALFDALSYQALNLLQLRGGDDGADVYCLVQGIADAQFLHAGT